MKKYIVLLRGINVGGNNLLPMKALTVLLESNGFQGVQSYIQSGNVLLLADSNPEQKIKQLIEAEFGFMPKVLVFSEADFSDAVASNPYAEYEGKAVHFYFCERAPELDHARVEKLISPSEAFKLVDSVFYLYAPDGIGRSKLVASIETCLASPATGRNLNTIKKLAAMLKV